MALTQQSCNNVLSHNLTTIIKRLIYFEMFLHFINCQPWSSHEAKWGNHKIRVMPLWRNQEFNRQQPLRNLEETMTQPWSRHDATITQPWSYHEELYGLLYSYQFKEYLNCSLLFFTSSKSLIILLSALTRALISLKTVSLQQTV